MNTNSCKTIQTNANASFDLFRLSKSKEAVDVCPNTLRAYHEQGLPFYRNGKAVFVSKNELELFIRNPAAFHVSATISKHGGRL